MFTRATLRAFLSKELMRNSIPQSNQPSLQGTWLSAFTAAINLPRVTIPADFTERFAETAQGRRIYVENLRSALNVRTQVARALLGVASGRGLLTHKVQLLCPNSECGRALCDLPFADVIFSKFPESVRCDICESMERDVFEFPGQDCPRLDMYEVRDLTTSSSQ